MFYHYDQNNSGGSFDIDDNVTLNVIIEAENAMEADMIAERIGIYFNGVEDDMDCECCGDRWTPQWKDGTDVPLIYDKPPAEHRERLYHGDQPITYVYYLDGSKQVYYQLTNIDK